MSTTLGTRPTGDSDVIDVVVEPLDIDVDPTWAGDDADQPPRPPGRWHGWRPLRVTASGVVTALIGVLTAVMYTWNLSANGMANSYYAAAVRSGALSWKAMFFGSIDPGSFITVDKPPAAMWVMSLSARIFGFSSWSMLLPEALAGVAGVLILHRLVRKWQGDLAAHLAALAFALTPVAALMFRFNNPDAFLTLTCLGAAWGLWRAIETGRTRFLVAAGALVGLGFMTKMLQAFLILPALAIAYLWAGPPRLRRRLAQLGWATLALIVSSGWWVAIVALWPASARPYIGSTDDNSILSLVFGYNGLGRIFGASSGSNAGANFGGTPGWLRLFDDELAGQVAWLIPIAAIGLLAGLWATRRAPRTDAARAGWLLWGGWAVVCAAVFSLSQGGFHPYYTVELAPALAALAGAGAVQLWRQGRATRWLVWALPAAIALTTWLAVEILARTPDYHPWLRTVIAIGGGTAAVGLLVAGFLGVRWLAALAGGLAAAAVLAGPTAYSLTTITTAQTGSTVSAGPAAQGSRMGGMGGAPSGGQSGSRPSGDLPSGGFPSGGPSGSSGTAATTTSDGGAAQGGGPSGQTAGGTVDSGLISYLEANRDGAEYLVATFGSQSSASIIIATGEPVVTIGGFTGSDPAPTLTQFEQMVADGQVRYVLVSGQGGGGMGGSSEITSWVTAHGTVVDASEYGGSTSAGTLYLVTA